MSNFNKYHDLISKSKSLYDVIRCVKDKSQASIATIAKETDYSQPTVATALKAGLEIGIITSDEESESTGGRKAQLYAFDENFMYILLIVVTNEMIEYKIKNLSGEDIDSGSTGYNFEEFLFTLTDLVKDIKCKFDKIELCAISMPCVINDGVIVDWNVDNMYNDVNIKEQIAEKVGIEVWVMNDMNAFAVAQAGKLYKETRGIHCSLYIDNNNLACGTIVWGRLMKGASGYAGELTFNSGALGLTPLERAVRAVRIVISTYNPHTLTLHCKKVNPDFVIQRVKRKMPKAALPKFYVCNEYISSVFNGLFILIERSI